MDLSVHMPYEGEEDGMPVLPYALHKVESKCSGFGSAFSWDGLAEHPKAQLSSLQVHIKIYFQFVYIAIDI